MAKKTALLFLAIFSPVILLTFLFSHPAAQVFFAIPATAFPVALIAIGASKQGQLGPLRLPLFALLTLQEGCVVAMILLRGKVIEAPWIGGLPLAAAIQLYAAWLMPLALVALAYGLTFDNFSLKEEDLARISQISRLKDNFPAHREEQ